jgi:hypothetical protein
MRELGTCWSMRGKMGSRNELIYLFLTVCSPDIKKFLMAFIFLPS